MRRWTLAAIAAAALLAQPLHAQRSSTPRRPKLGDIADTNDAHAYLDHGFRMAGRDPHEAANAFYWATRIDPGLSEAFYGRRIALILDQDGLMEEQMRGGRRSSKAMQALDSLELRAMMDAFLRTPALPAEAIADFRAFAAKQGVAIPAGADADARLQRALVRAVCAAKWGEGGWYRADVAFDPQIGAAVRGVARASALAR